MSKLFESSRLSQGNKIFPTTVEIDDYGVTVRIPGFFSGKSETISFDHISSVKIDTPMVGFSSITFDTNGFGRVTGNGFTKDEVTEMRELIQRGKSSLRGGYNPINTSQATQVIHTPIEHESVQLRRLELERERELERIQSDKEFVDGIKSHIKKYWKIWIGAIVALFIISSVKNYLHEQKIEEENKEYDRQLNINHIR